MRKVEIELRSLNVLIGANGAGKSNFIALFKMLNQMMQENLQVFVAQSGGANSLLYFGQKVTDRIEISLRFGLDSYYCELLPTADDRMLFGEEYCRHCEPGSNQVSENARLDKGYNESILPGKAAKTRVPRFILRNDREGGLPKEVEKLLDSVFERVLLNILGWQFYHFHDTSDSALVKKFGAINDNFYLRRDAGNLAAFLYKLQRTTPHQYEAIRDTIRLVAPFFDDFILRPWVDNPDNIRLEWRERGSDYPFLAHHLSDGTLRFMCLATLLLQPDLPDTILIDEPELGLHPYAVSVLASLMRSVSARTQIIVSTQSVSLVNQFEAEDLLIVEREGHETVIKDVDSQKLKEWIEEYSLGELWEKNVLGGRPS